MLSSRYSSAAVDPLGGVDGQEVYLPCGSPTKGVEARLERRLNDPLEACVPVVRNPRLARCVPRCRVVRLRFGTTSVIQG